MNEQKTKKQSDIMYKIKLITVYNLILITIVKKKELNQYNTSLKTCKL